MEGINCNTSLYESFLYPMKSILNIIMIIAPILLIISLAILITKLVTNPDEKKNIKKLKNAIIALVFVFIIPVLVNAFMYLCNDKFTFSSCWNSADSSVFSSTATYIETSDVKKGSVIQNPNDYEKGVPRALDFSYSGNGTVKSQFSSETLKIVEEHINDFNYNNFRSYMSSHGGAANYIKNLGGVFTEYYGNNTKVTTALEFQKVSEYVFGLMYIYGFDYYNGSKYCKWGGSCDSGSNSASDAFYPSTMKHTSDGLSDNTHNFDSLITAKDEINMTTNCNWTVDMVYYKAGIFNSSTGTGTGYTKQCRNTLVKNVTDFKVGDIIHFFSNSISWNSDPSTWSGWYHVAYVGEVYDDKVVFYDGGSYFTNNRNYKWEIKRDNSVTTIHGTKNWAVCRAWDIN